MEAGGKSQKNSKRNVRVPEQKTNCSHYTFGTGGPIFIEVILFPKL